MRIGAQFFTLREHCQTLEGLAQSLKKVADIGYEYVQISGTCAYDADWLKQELDRNGLKCVLTHIAPDRLINETQKVAADHDIFDCRHVGLGYFGFNEAEDATKYDTFVKTYKPVAEELKTCGKYFMYHNHAHEFTKLGGKTILGKLSEDFAPDELGFTLDTYWVQAGGGDPAQWIELLSGRVPCIHLKDMVYDKQMAVIGEGNINFDRVFEKAETSGTEYMIVEQDHCYGEDPFECLKRSYNYLKAQGFK